MQVPILLRVFARPETTAQVFAAILAVRPERLYVAALSVDFRGLRLMMLPYYALRPLTQDDHASLARAQVAEDGVTAGASTS